jgi:hypothetical protein
MVMRFAPLFEPEKSIMSRSRIALVLLGLTSTCSAARADAFDGYTNPVLAGAPGAAGVQEVKRLTPEMIAEHDSVLRGQSGALLVVKTNEGRFSKLLVEAARQKVNATIAVPIMLIHRFVTYREGQERAIQAAGQNVDLFDGFRFNLDLGQVVPPVLGADFQFVAKGESGSIEPVGKARLHLVTRPLPQATPKRAFQPVIGEAFEARYFEGTYKLHDDGRRSGTLTLHVGDDGAVTGAYYSDKDGRKYAVEGKVGRVKNTIDFTIHFPRSEQTFHGWLFTGDAKALTGFARFQERETGFYALRVDSD